jgi:hypothetical protein
MFKLDQSQTYAWPVTVQIPVDGGRYVAETFDAHFKRLPQAQLEALRKAALDGALTDLGFAHTVMGGWAGVTDGGADVPFSVAALEQLLQIPGTAAAIVEAFVASQTGAPRKN